MNAVSNERFVASVSPDASAISEDRDISTEHSEDTERASTETT